MYVFLAFGGFEANETIIIIGLGRWMCVFLVFGGPESHEAPIIIGSGSLNVRVSRVWRPSCARYHYNIRVWEAQGAYFTCVEGVGRPEAL